MIPFTEDSLPKLFHQELDERQQCAMGMVRDSSKMALIMKETGQMILRTDLGLSSMRMDHAIRGNSLKD